MASLNVRPPSAAPDVSDMEPDEAKVAMLEWFRENFEDPVENTPYESAEGGYQYIWGGPYEAREEIENYFSEASEELIDEVVDELESDGVEWAPNAGRVYDEEREMPPETSAYKEVQTRLDEVERTMALIEPVSSLIGNNKPPEEIGVPPYSDEDKKEIEQAIKELRKPEAQLMQNREGTENAAEVLKTKGEKLKDFFARHGDKFVESFAAQLGKRAADSLTFALWLKLSAALVAAYHAAVKLISSGILTLPF
ncbi:MAG: hypothetical protein K2Y27_00155 [Xanthobacteraceae bacterium]|nr:hypothetical protein [Xanthobacteraceae bacterium]